MDTMSAGRQYKRADHQLGKGGHPNLTERILRQVREESPVQNIAEVRAGLRAEAQCAQDADEHQTIHRDDSEARERPHEGFKVETTLGNGKSSRGHVYPPNALRSTTNKAKTATTA